MSKEVFETIMILFGSVFLILVLALFWTLMEVPATFHLIK